MPYMKDSTGRRLDAFKVAEAPTRRAAYSLGGAGSNGTQTNVSDASVRYPFRLTVPTKRFRIHVRNHDYKTDGAGVGTLNFTGLWVGEHSLSTNTASGNAWTGGFTATPTQVEGAFTITDDGEHISPWITASGSQLAAGKHYLLGLGFTCTLGTAVWRSYGAMYYASGAGNAANAAQTAALGSYFGSPALLDVWIEYEFTGTNPVGLFIGDSLTEARTGAAVQGIDPTGQDGGYPQQHAQRGGSVAIVNAYSGDTASSWQQSFMTKWGRFPTVDITPDFVMAWLLTNDIGNNVDSLTTMQTNFIRIITNIRALYGNSIPIYTATILPRGLAGAQETNRTALNAWLSGRPKNIAGCFDFDRAVRNPATVTALDADFDSGDTLHLNTRGYSKLAATMGGRLLTANAS